MRVMVAAMLAGACLATPALAADRTGYQAIAAGDFATAAKQIEAERRIFPDRPELMLNLAAAYLRTGRTADARALYRGCWSGRRWQWTCRTVPCSHRMTWRREACHG